MADLRCWLQLGSGLQHSIVTCSGSALWIVFENYASNPNTYVVKVGDRRYYIKLDRGFQINSDKASFLLFLQSTIINSLKSNSFLMYESGFFAADANFFCGYRLTHFFYEY